MEREGEDKTPKKDGSRETAPCRFFNTDTGCRKGKECRWLHTVEEGKKRCWVCGATDHYAGSCTRPKDQKSGDYRKSYPKNDPKSIQKAETETPRPQNENPKESETQATNQEESGEVMKGLLEEANRMLKALKETKEEESGERAGKLQRLQKQLDDLKAVRVFRIASLGEGRGHGLLDSGATHALRGRKEGEALGGMQEVKVSLACGRETLLKMTMGGTMVASNYNTEPIVPLGKLVKDLECKIGWDDRGLVVVHPKKGKLEVYDREGCPHVPKEVALELIQELEEKEQKKIRLLKKGQEEKEEDWIRELIKAHPVLRKLPEEIQSQIVTRPATDLKMLPGVNRHRRKKVLSGGAVVHLFAGEDEGYTLKRALKEVGGDTITLLEFDVLRGEDHDVLAAPLFSSLLRLAIDGGILAVVGGPNCRTRSVLRHYPIPGGPRPVRAWQGEEFGKKDNNEQEQKQVLEDDVLMWRMILLFVVADEANKAKEGGSKEEKKVWFGLEQPAFPDYMPEVVSFWKTSQWEQLAEMYGFEMWHFNQGDWGGEAVKPTTWGGSLEIQLPEKRNRDARARGEGEKKDSKRLARWAPGMMRSVAVAIQKTVNQKRVAIRNLPWKEHIQHGHIPFRKDCRVCQEAAAKTAPHRRVVGVGGGKARGGVLSVDTTGPLVKGKDVDTTEVRFLLIGAFTWMVPKGSRLSEGQEIGEEQEKEDEDEIVFDEEAVEPEDERPKRGRPKKKVEEEEKMREDEIRELEEKPEAEDEKDDKKEEEGKEDQDKPLMILRSGYFAWQYPFFLQRRRRSLESGSRDGDEVARRRLQSDTDPQ